MHTTIAMELINGSAVFPFTKNMGKFPIITGIAMNVYRVKRPNKRLEDIYYLRFYKMDASLA